MLDLPSDLPADIVPLSWLLGVWEGTGVIDYEVSDLDGGTHRYAGEFAHRVSFSHDGGPFLNYAATATVTPEDGEPFALVAETGFWRLARPAGPEDAGPALLPPREPRTAARTVDDVESLRLSEGGFAIEVSIAHSDGMLELYLGRIDGPRVDIATDAVVRAAGTKDYRGASRMYGLVDGHLLWAWDIAALGAELGSHASARLAKV